MVSMLSSTASFHLHSFFFFFFNDTATTEIYTLSLHDALPISGESQHNGQLKNQGQTKQDGKEQIGVLGDGNHRAHAGSRSGPDQKLQGDWENDPVAEPPAADKQ